MSVSDEKRREILELVAAGKLTAGEAAGLLSGESQWEAVSEESLQPKKRPEDVEELIHVEPDPALKYTQANGGKQPSWLRVRVSDLKSGRNKVTVNIPMRLMRFGLAVGSRFAPELEGLDWDELAELMSTEKGLLVDVQDEEDGEHVQIYVE